MNIMASEVARISYKERVLAQHKSYGQLLSCAEHVFTYIYL
jgi:hypothetical protein